MEAMEATIRNVICDLGGVLYRIDAWRTVEALRSLSSWKEKSASHFVEASRPIARLYETGALSTPEFRARMRQALEIVASDEAFDAAWNALLLHVFPDSVEMVRKLRSRARVVLLSNTNEIHHTFFAEDCEPLFSLLNRTYFSYRCGLAKPDEALFARVLSEMTFAPGETIFLDDSVENVEAAKKLGIRTFLIDPKVGIAQLATTLPWG